MNIEAIWSEYRASLKAFFHSKVSNPAEVDDLLQEILIKTYQNLHAVQSENSIKPWLFQITNRVIIDFYRRQASKPEITAESLWYNEDSNEVEQSLSQCIAPLINALPTESATLLTAIDLNGQSQKAYAEEQGISYSTLKSRVQKSRKALRELFEDCCHLTLDRQGNVADYDTKSNTCKKC